MHVGATPYARDVSLCLFVCFYRSVSFSRLLRVNMACASSNDKRAIEYVKTKTHSSRMISSEGQLRVCSLKECLS